MRKHTFKVRLLSLVALCGIVMAFASCSNEDVAQGNVETNTEKNSNLTSFVTGAATTRTSLNYDDGAFFWEAGDYIYVKDDNGTWNKSSNAPTEKTASFKFMVPGKYTNSTTYKVYYPGKNGLNNNVTISAAQSQAQPNSTTHIGEAGDCGTADATGGNGVFTRNHKLKAGSLLCWSIVTLLPCSVIILYIDMITSLPEESTVVIVE